jgi:hypothetical protein
VEKILLRRIGNHWSEPEMIYIVLGLGALGAFVSLQRRLKNLGSDDLQLLSSSWFNAWLVPVVGGVLATVLYCLFLSGLLSGELFPSFCKAVIEKYKEPATMPSQPSGFWRLLECQGNEPKDYAKLFLWSFVVGFREVCSRYNWSVREKRSHNRA